MLPQMLTHILLTVSVFRMVRYMVDAADREKVEASRNELHNLLDKPQLQGIPVSVVVKPVCFLQRSCSTITCRSWGFQFVMCFLFFSFQVLVLGNKRDLPTALDEKQLIEKM